MDTFYDLNIFLLCEKLPESPSFCSRWEGKNWGAAFDDSDFCLLYLNILMSCILEII